MAERMAAPGFLGRLRFYVIGLAIGCVLMGMFQLAKQREAREKAAAAERASQQPAQDSVFPALPDATAPKPASK
jgi:hypothetical protein